MRFYTAFHLVLLHGLFQSLSGEGESVSGRDLTSSPLLNWQLPLFSPDVIPECVFSPTALLRE